MSRRQVDIYVENAGLEVKVQIADGARILTVLLPDAEMTIEFAQQLSDAAKIQMARSPRATPSQSKQLLRLVHNAEPA